MKKFSTISIALYFQTMLFGQLSFMPIGAVYTSEKSWSTGGPPPSYYSFHVTEDTTIQGKYCTRLEDGEWPNSTNPDERTYVHQDGYQIYRFDEASQEFKLALDFSKQVGEAWKVEVDENFFGTDTVTITVTEVLGMRREVSIQGGSGGMDGLYLYEGFGGLSNSRLLLTPLWFIWTDPSFSETVKCYEDPIAGVMYGQGEHCFTATNEGMNQSIGMAIYPNPASDVLNFQLKVLRPLIHATFRIVNAEGRVMEEIKTTHSQGTFSMPVQDWTAGAYFLQYIEDGKVRAVEQFLVVER